MTQLFIFSHERNIERREAIRQSYLKYNPPHIRYLFVIGRPYQYTDFIIEGDTLFVKCRDTYEHLSFKTKKMLQFAHTHNVSALIKVDDDTFINWGAYSASFHNRDITGWIFDKNYQNVLYASGACYMLTRKIINHIVANYNPDVGAAEDVLIGAAAQSSISLTIQDIKEKISAFSIIFDKNYFVCHYAKTDDFPLLAQYYYNQDVNIKELTITLNDVVLPALVIGDTYIVIDSNIIFRIQEKPKNKYICTLVNSGPQQLITFTKGVGRLKISSIAGEEDITNVRLVYTPSWTSFVKLNDDKTFYRLHDPASYKGSWEQDDECITLLPAGYISRKLYTKGYLTTTPLALNG